ncbi:hypothetical protein ACVQKV_09915 [Edwardsiella tarda]
MQGEVFNEAEIPVDADAHGDDDVCEPQTGDTGDEHRKPCPPKKRHPRLPAALSRKEVSFACRQRSRCVTVVRARCT